MLTLEKLMKECPLSQFDDIPDNLNYFLDESNLCAAYQDGIFLWKQKKYFLFFLTAGSIFEFILFEIAHLATIQLYRASNREHLLPRSEVFLQPRRNERDNLSTIFKELENKDRAYITNGSFYRNDKLWTEAQCLKYVIHQYTDKAVYNNSLLKHLLKIKEFRNSCSHGNFKGLYKKLYPDYYIPGIKKIDFITGEKENLKPQALKDFSNEMRLGHMIGFERNKLAPYIKQDCVNFYIQTGYILDFILKKLQHEEMSNLAKILPTRKVKKKKKKKK